MRITSVIEHNGEPALGIPYTNTDGVLFRIRVKALNTGIILEGFHKAVTGEDPGIIMLPHILKVDEQVAYDVHPVRMSDVEEWYGSDECISLLDFLASRSSEGPAPETDNAPAEYQSEENMIASPRCGESECRICGGKLKPWEVDCCDKCKEDQDHEQGHQDHEPEVETEVVQDDPETGQNDDETVETRELTDLQRSVMRCLSMEDCSVADIAEAMGRTTNSDKVQIRKTCHDLVDMGLAVKKDVIVQNGRPAQIWGVM